MLSIRHISALIRYHLKIEPENLFTEDEDGGISFDKFFRTWGELQWVLEREMTPKLE